MFSALTSCPGLSSLSGLIYLRKVANRSVLGEANLPILERAESVAQAIFFSDHYETYSLFSVCDDDSLRRVCIGYNGGRNSLTSDIHWMIFTQAEVASSGVTLNPTFGGTWCRYANGRHFDLSSNRNAIIALCQRALLRPGPTLLSVSKAVIRPWAEQAQTERCLAAVRVPHHCSIDACNSPPPQQTGGTTDNAFPS